MTQSSTPITSAQSNQETCSAMNQATKEISLAHKALLQLQQHLTESRSNLHRANSAMSDYECHQQMQQQTNRAYDDLFAAVDLLAGTFSIPLVQLMIAAGQQVAQTEVAAELDNGIES